jgi:catechol 2,3-dioxygenase-like lactoylglutathione lyase family enzyme
MTDDRPAPPNRFRAAIRAYDLDRSVEFYRDHLGLRVLSHWDRDDGAGVLLESGGGIIELLGKPPGMKVRGGWDFIPPTPKIDLIFEVDDVDAWHAALTARGLEPQSAPENTPWGGRKFTILDPDETPVMFLSSRRGTGTTP